MDIHSSADADIEAIIESILKVLSETPEISAEELSPTSDLLLDVGLDSVQMMQLLVALETRYGISIPETALNKEDISTVQRLAEKLAGTPAADVAAGAKVSEPELDIKVHCLVSCLCEPFRKNPDIDHRPFYFGVPDAEIFIDESGGLTYHNTAVNHDFFIHWFQLLYQVSVDRWYDPDLPASVNVTRLAGLLDQRRASEWIMVMLDLYQLPERENKFNKNPFPHYVVLENTADPDQIWMWDPDFRWEGTLSKARVMNAINQPTVGGGYRVFFETLRAPEPKTIALYFHACFNSEANPMTDAARRVIALHTGPDSLYPSSSLATALRELPVLAIRKYGYEHCLAFFWRELGLPDATFEAWCTPIEKLVRGYEKAQFLATRLAENADPVTLAELHRHFDEQDQLEFSIKQELYARFQQWQRQTFEGVRGSAKPVFAEVSA